MAGQMAALKLSQRLGVFYGWIVVGGLVMISTVASGTGQYTFGVFVKPFMEEFLASRAAVSATVSIYWIGMGLSGPFMGRLMDAYGPRKIILLAGVLNTITLVFLSLSTALWHVYALYAMKSLAHSAIATVGIGALVSRWFFEKRGMAMGFGVTSFGLGGLLLIPLTGYLIPQIGWRMVYLTLAVMVIVVTLPIATFVLKNTPEEMGLFPDGKNDPIAPKAQLAVTPLSQSSQLEGSALHRAVRTASFWFLAVAFFLVGMSVFGTMTHQIPYLTDMGISVEAAAVALGFTAGMGILGKLVWGYLSDRLQVRYVAMLCFSIQALGVLILMQATGLAMVWVYVVVFGFAMGGLAVMMGVLPMSVFHSKSIAPILGAIALAMSFGAALGPFVAGYIFDLLGNYTLSFMIFLVAYALAVTATYAARPRKT